MKPKIPYSKDPIAEALIDLSENRKSIQVIWSQIFIVIMPGSICQKPIHSCDDYFKIVHSNGLSHLRTA
jgi:hypothetical protein